MTALAPSDVDIRDAAPVLDVAQADLLLTTTRSVRRRLDLTRPVPRHLIEAALEVAVQAPTAENEQNWHWLVVTDPRPRQALAEVFQRVWRFHRTDMGARSSRRRNTPAARRLEDSVARLAETIAEVPVLVLPCLVGPPPNATALDEAWQARIATTALPPDNPIHRSRVGPARLSRYYGSIYPAIWSFQLALRARGLGSTITCLHLPFAEAVGAALGIPQAVSQICLLPVAYTIGTDFSPARRVPARDRTYWQRWGNSGAVPTGTGSPGVQANGGTGRD